jgi:hypothetical protein
VTISPIWTLRIPQRKPHQLRIDRLAEYMLEFASLLGLENEPMFAGIKDASTGLRAKVPAIRRNHVWKRIQTARVNPASKPARHLRLIEAMLGEDHLSSAELRDTNDKVIYLFQPHEQHNVSSATIRQHGEVDGVVTGLVGADDTMHLHVRDSLARDLKLIVRNEEMARGLLKHFRRGCIRLRVHGVWSRTEDGWVPESNRCVVDGFDVLDDTPASDIFAQIASIPGNGWCDIDDPLATWRDLRGIH